MYGLSNVTQLVSGGMGNKLKQSYSDSFLLTIFYIAPKIPLLVWSLISLRYFLGSLFHLALGREGHPLFPLLRIKGGKSLTINTTIFTRPVVHMMSFLFFPPKSRKDWRRELRSWSGGSWWQ